jgi:hypothetical protein
MISRYTGMETTPSPHTAQGYRYDDDGNLTLDTTTAALRRRSR